MRVLIFIDHMECGGAARVTSLMCNGLAARGYHVVLAYNCQRNTLYKCDNSVEVVDNHICRNGKNHLAGIMLLIRRVIRYHEIIRDIQPDVVVGVEPEPYLYARLATICSRRPVVAVDHTSYRNKLHWFTNWIRWHAYGWADAVSILSHVDEAILNKKLPNKVVIHNPISFPIFEKNTHRENIILCVGRLDGWNVKGFDRIIDIWGRIAQYHPKWKLVICGGGLPSSLAYLQNLATKNQINQQIAFIGEQKDVISVYQKAAIFALPSRIEGFPMCLLEAASQGCACISFALGGVAKEIFKSPQSGYIIEDNQEILFGEKLHELINDEARRTNCSISIRQDVAQFTMDNFISAWERVLNNVTKSKE